MNLLYVLLFLLGVVNCYKILVVFPVFELSHYFLGNALAKGLAKAGHEVTMVSAFEEKNPPKNYKNVILTGFADEASRIEINPFDMGKAHPWLMLFGMNFLGDIIVNSTFNHPNFKEILDEHFDVIIIEQFLNDAMKVLQCHFQAPLIIFSTIGANPWVNVDVGNPSPPSYIPNIFLNYSNNMNLWQRIFNSLTDLFQKINMYFIFYPAQNEFIKIHFPKCANNELAMSNVSLTLLNSHESSNSPVPLVPNMINIGGFHISTPKELPIDLQKYMDNAKDGVIFFSLGTHIKSSRIDPKTKESLLRVFGKLKQKVIWKYDQENIEGKPDNVKLGKWFPQADILAHPNTKLFITHGGLLSTLETIYHGIPVICLPVFADQKMNAAKAVTSGYGLKIPFSEITEESLTKAINELLNNSKYRENVKLRSSLAHDRPIKPLDLAIYWTEFIAKYKGAPHLKVAGLYLAWYQYLLLDVIVIVGLVSSIIVTIIYLILKKICCSRKDKMKKD